MSKSVCFNQTYLVIAIVFIILILYLIISKSNDYREASLLTNNFHFLGSLVLHKLMPKSRGICNSLTFASYP